MLVPCWPTQTWFTRLVSLLIEQPIPIQVTQRGNVHPLSPKLTATGMQSIREHFTNCKIPEDITNVLMHSWRPSTHKQYDVYIKKWTTFCLQRTINYRAPNVNDVLTFLHEFHKRKLSYSTINTARSAFKLLNGFPVSWYSIHSQFSSICDTISQRCSQLQETNFTVSRHMGCHPCFKLYSLIISASNVVPQRSNI